MMPLPCADFSVNENIRLICAAPHARPVAAGSVKLEHGGKAACDLDVDEKDVARITKASARKRMMSTIVAILIPGASFILGLVLGTGERDDSTSGTYPLAVAMAASAPVISRQSAKRILDPRTRKDGISLVGLFVASVLLFVLGWVLGSAGANETETATRYGVVDSGPLN